MPWRVPPVEIRPPPSRAPRKDPVGIRDGSVVLVEPEEGGVEQVLAPPEAPIPTSRD